MVFCRTQRSYEFSEIRFIFTTLLCRSSGVIFLSFVKLADSLKFDGTKDSTRHRQSGTSRSQQLKRVARDGKNSWGLCDPGYPYIVSYMAEMTDDQELEMDDVSWSLFGDRFSRWEKIVRPFASSAAVCFALNVA